MGGAGVDGGERVFAQVVFIYRWGRVEKCGRERGPCVWGALSEKSVCENNVHKCSLLLLNLLVLNAQFLRERFSVAKKRAKFCNWP